MENLKLQLEVLIEQGQSFDLYSQTINHNGYAKDVKLISYNKPQGRAGHMVSFCEDFENIYNQASIEAGKAEIEADIAAQKAIEAEAEAKRIAEQEAAEKAAVEAQEKLKADYEAQIEAERGKLAAIIERNNEKPLQLKKFSNFLGWSINFLLAFLLVGLNRANGTFFLGAHLDEYFIYAFAGVFGIIFLHSTMYNDKTAFKYVSWILPADLALAVFIKPFLGETLVIEKASDLILTLSGWGLILFVVIYGVQIFHAGLSAFRFINPENKEDKEAELEYKKSVLNAYIKK